MNPFYKPGWRGQRGGTGTRILVVFFLIGVVVLFLLARGCYNAVSSFRKSFNSTTRSKATTPDPDRFAFPLEKCPDFPPDEAVKQRAAQAAAKIPLIPGLILDGVLAIQNKDIEGLAQLASEDNNTLTFTYSGSGFHRQKGDVIVDQAFRTNPYTFCRSELPSSPVFVGRMYDKHPAVFSVGTYHQISVRAFQQLRETGYTQLVIHSHAVMKEKHLAFEGDQPLTLRRTDHGDAKYRVIVNGQLTDLPAITADGRPHSGSGQLHFSVLDDASFPLIFVWEWAGQSDSSKLVKITYPVQTKIEKELKDEGRAEIYGIYFDFDNDQIRSESEPVLAEIADVLKKQAEWKLNVEGHTDNVGGDKHNLDLSQRRAASVINALVTRYQISADRLSPAGYGASKPKATNDTVEGRALNRRVELVRK
jgi:outer membrane protein OmpA-like peptidoglycan-associated protein